VEHSLLTASSVLFDALYLPGDAHVNALLDERDAIEWVQESFRHCKPIAASGRGLELLRRCPGALDSGAAHAKHATNGNGGDSPIAAGLVLTQDSASPAFVTSFVEALASHRFWNRLRRNRLDAGGDRGTRGYAPPPPENVFAPLERRGA
jgi:catalase